METCLLCRQLDSDRPEAYQIPAEIVSAWKTAVQNKSKAAKNAVFTAFLQAGKDWGRFPNCNKSFVTCFSTPSHMFPHYHNVFEAAREPHQDPDGKHPRAMSIWSTPQLGILWTCFCSYPTSPPMENRVHSQVGRLVTNS